MKRLIVILLLSFILSPFFVLGVGKAEVEEKVTPEEVEKAEWEVGVGPYNMDEYERLSGKKITSFNEAPMLKERVAAGKLPAVEQRLPDNPLVMIPWEQIGNYGGEVSWFEFTVGYDTYLRHINDVTLLELGPSSGQHRYSGPGGPVNPGVLENWQVSEDGKAFTFQIRKGLKWSDGVPVTTEDVLYTINDVIMNEEINPRLPTWANWGGEPVKLDIIDDYTFRLTFARSYGLLLDEMRTWRWSYLVNPKHYLKQFHTSYTPLKDIEPLMKEKEYSKDEWGKFYGFIQMGATGAIVRQPNAMDFPTLDPWLVIRPTPEEFILERNPYFYKIDPEGNQLPYLDRIHRRMVTDLEMQVMKVISGESDVQCQYLRLSDYPLLQENAEKGGYNLMPLKVWQVQMLVFYLNLSPEDPELRKIVQDVRFRQALSLSINREEMKESLYLGFGRPAQATTPRGSDFFEEEFEKAFAEYDPKKANELLDKMGLDKRDSEGFRLRTDGERLVVPIEYYNVTPPATPGAELYSEYLKDIGIHAPVKLLDGGLYWKIHGANQYLLSIQWWGGGNPLNNFIFRFYSIIMWNLWYTSAGEQGEEPLPWAKRIFELYEILQSTTNREERTKAGKEMFRILSENLWFIGTVADTISPMVFSKKLGNIASAVENDYYTLTVLDAAEQWFYK